MRFITVVDGIRPLVCRSGWFIDEDHVPTKITGNVQYVQGYQLVLLGHSSAPPPKGWT